MGYIYVKSTALEGQTELYRQWRAQAHKEGLVYRPQLDNWSPARGWDSDDPSNLPNLMTYRDSMALYEANKGVRQAAMFPNVLPVEPANEDVKPFLSTVLFTHGDIFPMFDMPFRYGGGWAHGLVPDGKRAFSSLPYRRASPSAICKSSPGAFASTTSTGSPAMTTM